MPYGIVAQKMEAHLPNYYITETKNFPVVVIRVTPPANSEP